MATKTNLPALLQSDVIKNRFNEVLGKNAAGFTSALLNIYNGSKQLQDCDARSILGAAGLAATLNLSITPTLGQAYVMPFGRQATFVIGVKGLIQLAHRTGKYTALHAGKVCEGEISVINESAAVKLCRRKIALSSGKNKRQPLPIKAVYRKMRRKIMRKLPLLTARI